MTKPLEFNFETDATGTCMLGIEPVSHTTSLYLGRERLATDKADWDITGTLRRFNLPTAVAPGEWPESHLPTVGKRASQTGTLEQGVYQQSWDGDRSAQRDAEMARALQDGHLVPCDSVKIVIDRTRLSWRKGERP